MTCECCRERNASTYLAMRQFAAHLCADCAGDSHALDQCLLCGARVWHCARVYHVGAMHQTMMQKLVNDPFRELTPAPTQKLIGKLHFPIGRRKG